MSFYLINSVFLGKDNCKGLIFQYMDYFLRTGCKVVIKFNLVPNCYLALLGLF